MDEFQERTSASDVEAKVAELHRMLKVTAM